MKVGAGSREELLVSTRSALPGPASALVAGVWLWAGPAAACEPVRIAEGDLAALPAPWREALVELAAATGREGRPWSCPGGTVAIVVDGPNGGRLSVTDAAGRTVTREVDGPEDGGPGGEALLARPLAAEPAAPAAGPVVAAPSAPVPGPPRAPAQPDQGLNAPPAQPRLLLDAIVGPRVSGPGAAMWVSGALRGSFPIDRWSAGLWARFDQVVVPMDDAPPDLAMSAFSVGAAVGRELYRGSFELRASLEPSIATVMMEAKHEREPDHPEGSRIAFRMGANLQAAFPLGDVLRAAVALDGDVAPAGFDGLAPIDARLPPVPVYTAGLSLGIGARIP